MSKRSAFSLFEIGATVVGFLEENPLETSFKKAVILQVLPAKRDGTTNYLIHAENDPKDYSRVISHDCLIPYNYEVQFFLKKISAYMRTKSSRGPQNVGYKILFDLEGLVGTKHYIYVHAKRKNSLQRKREYNKLNFMRKKANPEQKESENLQKSEKNVVWEENSYGSQLSQFIPPDLAKFARKGVQSKYSRRDICPVSKKPNVINLLEQYFVETCAWVIRETHVETARARLALTMEFVTNMRDMFDHYGGDWLLTTAEKEAQRRRIGGYVKIGDLFVRVTSLLGIDLNNCTDKIKNRLRCSLSTQSKQVELLGELKGFELCSEEYMECDHPCLSFGIDVLARLLFVFPKIVERPLNEDRFGLVCQCFEDLCQFVAGCCKNFEN